MGDADIEGAWRTLPDSDGTDEPIPNPVLFAITGNTSSAADITAGKRGGERQCKDHHLHVSFCSEPRQLAVILSVLITVACLLGILSLMPVRPPNVPAPIHPSSAWDPDVLEKLYPSREGLNNGLGRTPAMGWNSWNTLACDVDEEDVKAAADLIVSLGLKEVGYAYVNVDDCWHGERLQNGSITSDPASFPSGMKALGEYIHSKGLEFGIYSDAGWETCAGRPGSWGYEDIDAQTYASWGVDYLKYDNCNADGLPGPKIRYPIMRDALNATGRPILYSMCEWGVEDPAEWAGEVGNSWRTTADIQPTWKSVMLLLYSNNKWAALAGPGGFNDPDMLEVGVRRPEYGPVMSLAEEASHFALWALMKSPLLVGADLRSISPESLQLLKNKDIIAVNQMKTEKGRPDCQVWAVPLVDGSVAVVLFNGGDADECTIGVRPEEVGLSAWHVVQVRDLMQQRDLSLTLCGSEYRATVAPHAVQVVKLTAS